MLLAMTVLMSTCAFADTYQEKLQKALKVVETKLYEANVPAEVIPTILERVTKKPVTQAEADLLIDEVDKMLEIANGRTNAKDFKSTELADMLAETIDVASKFGLTVKLSTGKKVTVIEDSTQNVLSVKTYSELKNIALGIDYNKLKEAIRAAVVYADILANGEEDPIVDPKPENPSPENPLPQGPDGGKGDDYVDGLRTPVIATSMKKTGSNNGNMLLAGFGLLALGGAVFVVSKKKSVA